MKIAYIGSYPPRECGIGTFTQNLANAMKAKNHNGTNYNKSLVIAMNDYDETYAYPPEVKLTINQEQQADYLKAANFINSNGVDICILQHEFGIYGGSGGVYVLPLLHHVKVPILVTLHTILKTPSYTEKAILIEICKMADKVVVMSEMAITFLTSVYNVPKTKIALIAHGVPDFQFDKKQSKAEFKLGKKKVLMTFGFISRNKGIETVIKALPQTIRKHPEILYMVLGKTHPNVLRHSGEEYRNYLQLLITKLKLQDHVLLLNEFIDETELFRYLAACDIYITPYLHETQITSGTLSYAMGAGCAVVSTPYWHAAELLQNGKGRLFNFNDPDDLAQTLIELLDDPEKLKKIQEKAYQYGRDIKWPKIGEQYLNLARSILKSSRKKSVNEEGSVIDPLLLPPFSLAHIKRLTDDTGIIQHAKFGIPNLKEGYCLDDNARALLMSLMAYNQKKHPLALELMPIYLSYIHYMQNENGTFKNFLSFNRNFLDLTGSEDSFGRTIWALGYLMGNAPNDAYYQNGKLVFFLAVPNFEKLKSIRGIANTIIGVCYYLKSNPADEQMVMRLKNLSFKLVTEYENNRTYNWKWFENLLAYDNGILPLSLLHATQILNDPYIKSIALESMEFLTEQTSKNGYLSIIGNKKWYVKGEERSMFAQQPVNTLAMVLMYYQAYIITKDKKFLDKLFLSFMWFLGENDLRLSLYDFDTKGCCDGIEEYGINRNQGAESSLAYLISHLTVLQAYDDLYQPKEIKNVQPIKKMVNA